MADISFNEQKFGDFNSPLQATSIVQQASINDLCETYQKEVSERDTWVTRKRIASGLGNLEVPLVKALHSFKVSPFAISQLTKLDWKFFSFRISAWSPGRI